jgi:hypothetical protein
MDGNTRIRVAKSESYVVRVRDIPGIVDGAVIYKLVHLPNDWVYIKSADMF